MRTPKLECSKLIILIIGIALAIVIVFSMIMMAITQDLSPIDWILGGLFSLANVGVGFYYWKSRTENQIKLRSIYGTEITKGIIGSVMDNSISDDEDTAG